MTKTLSKQRTFGSLRMAQRLLPEGQEGILRYSATTAEVVYAENAKPTRPIGGRRRSTVSEQRVIKRGGEVIIL